MNYRRFGRTGWHVSEIGYGMWGMAGWSGSVDEQSMESLHLAVDLGCNLFDTAWAYGDGHSEQLLGNLLRTHRDTRLYTATKIPPRNWIWPSRLGFTLEDVFPPEHIEEYTHRSLSNLGVDSIDLLQFHVWEDAWIDDDRWINAVERLKHQELIHAIGISINRWEPWNGLRTVESGVVDAVQVIYNIFDQNPEDELFPLCEEMDVAVIARVPFDEGSLTGTLTTETTWPADDWRNSYFVPENLQASVERADVLKSLLGENLSMPEMALRFILSNPTVSTTVPGMRQPRHVRSNLAAGDKGPLPEELLSQLRLHRWVREPTEWSQ